MTAFLKVISLGKSAEILDQQDPGGSEYSLLSDPFFQASGWRGLPWAGPCLACEESEASSQPPGQPPPHSESFH